MGLTPERNFLQKLGQFGHDLRQPLNVAGLAVGNIRRRTLPVLSGAEQEYLSVKLDRIEEQLERARTILDAIDPVLEEYRRDNEG